MVIQQCALISIFNVYCHCHRIWKGDSGVSTGPNQQTIPKQSLNTLNEDFRMISLRLELMLLNLWQYGKNRIPSESKKLIAILYAAARLIIAKMWKVIEPPSLIKWYEKVFELCIMAKVSSQVSHSKSGNYWTDFDLIWSLVLEYAVTYDKLCQLPVLLKNMIL